jgi:hypothetical protein
MKLLTCLVFFLFTMTSCKPALNLLPGGLPSIRTMFRLMGEDFYFEKQGSIIHTSGAVSFARNFLTPADITESYTLPTLSPDGKYLAVYRIIKSASIYNHNVAVQMLVVDTATKDERVIFDTRDDTSVTIPHPYSALSSYGWIYYERQEIPDNVYPFWSDDGKMLMFRFENQTYEYEIKTEQIIKSERDIPVNKNYTDRAAFPYHIGCSAREDCPVDLTPALTSRDNRFQFYKLKREGFLAVQYILGYDTITRESFNHTFYNIALYAE